MEPGDVIIVKKVPADQIKIGDIVTVKVGTDANALITHRVVGFQTEDGEKMLILKGDANKVQDGLPISEARVVGRVVRVERQSIFTEIFSRFYGNSFA